jgi:hypothetical protein
LKNEVGQTSNPDSASFSEPVPYLPYLIPEKNKFIEEADSGSSAVIENKKSTLSPLESRAGRAEAQNTGGESFPAVPYLENGGRAGRAGRADPPTSLNGGGTRKISVGDRVRYVGKEHWQVCGDRVLTVKAIEGDNAVVTYPKWWLDKTLPIVDLELVVGKQCVKPS